MTRHIKVKPSGKGFQARIQVKTPCEMTLYGYGTTLQAAVKSLMDYMTALGYQPPAARDRGDQNGQ